MIEVSLVRRNQLRTVSSYDVSGVIAPPPKVEKASAIDTVAKVLPVIVAVFAALQPQRSRFWGLLAVALIFLAAGFYGQLSARLRNWTGRIGDALRIRKAFPEFLLYMRQFGEWFESMRSDSLHCILQDLVFRSVPPSPSLQIGYEKLQIVPVDVYKGFWSLLYRRIAAEKPSRERFELAVREFSFLVGSYNDTCVASVFDRLPPEIRQHMSDSVKSRLNLFQQQFAAFLDRYSMFLNGVSDKCETIDVRAVFRPPQPL